MIHFMAYVPVAVGYHELMGTHSEWNARRHTYTPLGNGWWRLDVLMVDDGRAEGRDRNPSIPFAITFNENVANDWLGVRMRLYYWLENLKRRFRSAFLS
jgi:hypothetical protein